MPNNVYIIPNKVTPECLKFPLLQHKEFNQNNIVLGFVGNIRYQTIINVSDVITESFPNISFHYYGDTTGLTQEQIEHIKNQERVFFHGPFKNPDDLASIYSQLDFVVCTYDTDGVNPRYAEPNKLYEAIFYNTPIIVSKGSFLAKKVERLQIGFSLDAEDKNDISEKIRCISKNSYQQYLEALESIPKEKSINKNPDFFKLLSKIL